MAFLDKYQIQEEGIKIKTFHFGKEAASVPWQYDVLLVVPDPG